MLHTCDICGVEYMLGEPHDCRLRLMAQRDAALSRLVHLRADKAVLSEERDRYRAALESLYYQSGETLDVLAVGGDEAVEYIAGIARRAIHPEEEVA